MGNLTVPVKTIRIKTNNLYHDDTRKDVFRHHLYRYVKQPHIDDSKFNMYVKIEMTYDGLPKGFTSMVNVRFVGI